MLLTLQAAGGDDVKQYRSWRPAQSYLLPPSPSEWLPRGHLVFFVLDVVEQLDLSEIERRLQSKDPRGTSPYHPRLMTGLLLYGYCVGLTSSRRLERATYEDVPFRVLCGEQHPDHSVISTFRKTHLAALEGLFVQVLRLCQAAGMVKLGHVALDGTKMAASASKHKAMSYGRMQKTEAELVAEVQRLLSQAEQVDAEEDAQYGPGVRGDELPTELSNRESRLEKLREARAALEAEAAKTRALEQQAAAASAREKAEAAEVPERRALEARAEQREAAAQASAERARELATQRVEPVREDADARAESATTPQERRAANAARERQHKAERDREATFAALADPAAPAHPSPLPSHRVPADSTGAPKPKAQRNFTDPDSRIMKQGSGYVQAYHAQAAVDAEHQIIVAQVVTNQAPDVEHFVPMLDRVATGCGRVPEVMTADAGYWSEPNATHATHQGVDAYIATGRTKHGDARSEPEPGQAVPEATEPPTLRAQMQAKVRSETGRAVYARRKAIVEPVFGQIKGARGIRAFLLRGLENVRAEWSLICTGHNLLKLYRAGLAGSA
jgi:transposase